MDKDKFIQLLRQWLYHIENIQILYGVHIQMETLNAWKSSESARKLVISLQARTIYWMITAPETSCIEI